MLRLLLLLLPFLLAMALSAPAPQYYDPHYDPFYDPYFEPHRHPGGRGPHYDPRYDPYHYDAPPRRDYHDRFDQDAYYAQYERPPPPARYPSGDRRPPPPPPRRPSRYPAYDDHRYEDDLRFYEDDRRRPRPYDNRGRPTSASRYEDEDEDEGPDMIESSKKLATSTRALAELMDSPKINRVVRPGGVLGNLFGQTSNQPGLGDALAGLSSLMQGGADIMETVPSALSNIQDTFES